MLCIGNIDVSFNWGIVNQRSDKRRIGRANSCGGRCLVKKKGNFLWGEMSGKEKGQSSSENCP
ncbi:hypothetical protein DEO02_18170 [Escherichia coli]|nr:hypothetical protein DEO02_18170 [Escherichia coli]